MPCGGRPNLLKKTSSICWPNVQLKELNHTVALMDVNPYAENQLYTLTL